MLFLNNSFYFGLDFNFAVDSPFVGSNSEESSFPPISGDFLLLDGTSFLLLDGTKFLLL